MSLQPGDILLNGQYRIGRLLGRGGFGFVYLAEDTLLQEEVALKELIPALVGDEALLKRFLAEAKATMRLRHERIVATHNVFSERGNYYIVMEYLAGGSLEARLAERGALPVDEAIHVAADVAEGLAYAHGLGVVHCDLKPANVLFTADGHAKIADFGIAHVPREMFSRSWVTAAGFVAGTLPYMSPEQADGVRDDPRADLYALGAVLYRMLTGRTYLDFDARETPGAQARNVQRIETEQPQPPSAHNRRVPAWLDGVVLKALAKQPADRYANASELLAALARKAAAPIPAPILADAETVVAPTPSRPTFQPQPRPRSQPQPFPKWLWPAIGGAAVLLITVIVALAASIPGSGKQTTAPTAAPTRVVVVTATPAPTRVASLPTKSPEPTKVPTAAPPMKAPEPTKVPEPIKAPTAAPEVTRATSAFIPTNAPLDRLPQPVGPLVDTDATWEMFSNGNFIHELTSGKGLIWAATEGGTVVWDPANSRYKKYTTWDGLPVNSTGSILSTLQSEIWISSGHSLFRFDGTRWTKMNIANLDVLLAVTKDGSIWAGNAGYDNELRIGRFISDSWQIFDKADGFPKVIGGGRIEAVASSDGSLWVSAPVDTGKSLLRYDGKSWRSYSISDGLPTDKIWILAVSPGGVLWVWNEEGIYRVADSKNALVVPADHINGWVLNGALTPDGNFWYATYDPQTGTGGLFRVDEKGVGSVAMNEGLPGTHATALLVGEDGVLWVGTDDGLAKREGPTWRSFRTSDGLGIGFVHRIRVSNSGSVWFAGQGGISRLVEGQWQTYHWRDGLPESSFRSVSFAPDGTVWAGGDGEGSIARFDGTRWRSYKLGTFYPYGSEVDAVISGPGDAVWAGVTYAGSGLWHLTGDTWEKANSPFSEVSALAVAPDGTLWAGSIREQNNDKSRVGRFHESTWSVYDESKGFNGGFGVEAFAFAPSGALYAGTFNGLFRFDGATWHPIEDGSGRITDISAAADGSIWIAAGDNGIGRYDGTTWRQRFRSDPRLPGFVMSVAVLQDGTVWFGGDGGTIRIKPRK